MGAYSLFSVTQREKKNPKKEKPLDELAFSRLFLDEPSPTNPDLF